jgi:hypothetical protein
VAYFLLLGTAVEAVAILTQFIPLIILEGERYAGVFTAAQLQAQAYLPFELQSIAFNLSMVFFAGYALTAGTLIYKSGFFPRFVGVLLAIGGMCYLGNGFINILAPSVAAGLVLYAQIAYVGELALCFWLLVKGLNVTGWEKQAGKQI